MRVRITYCSYHWILHFRAVSAEGQAAAASGLLPRPERESVRTAPDNGGQPQLVASVTGTVNVYVW